MSQSQTIINFINQNRAKQGIDLSSDQLADLKATKWSLDTATTTTTITSSSSSAPSSASPSASSSFSSAFASASSQRRIPLGHRFPFNRSDDLTLKDSRNSIRNGLTYSMKNYNDFGVSFKRMMNTIVTKSTSSPDKQEEQELSTNTAYDDEDEWVDVTESDIESEDENLQSALFSAQNSPNVSPASINGASFNKCCNIPVSIVRKNNSIEKSIGLENVRRKMSQVLIKRFYKTRHDPDTTEIINFTINTFLQDFDTPDLTIIANDLLEMVNDGSLVNELDDMFAEQYMQVKLYAFFDLAQSQFNKTEQNNYNSTERPSLYQSYANIWKLNPEDFRNVDYEYVKDELRTHRYYSNDSNDVIDDYCEFGLLMNFDKFLHYWGVQLSSKHGLSGNRKLKLHQHSTTIDEDQASKSDTRERHELRMALDRLRNSGIDGSKCDNDRIKKSLRFAEESEQVVQFWKTDPPAFVKAYHMYENHFPGYDEPQSKVGEVKLAKMMQSMKLSTNFVDNSSMPKETWAGPIEA